ncbi:MAG: Klebsiella phage vB KleM RaK2 [Bacteroidota bacterium]|jgi:DNA repair exonuclease SbcCD nuclease subunit
MNLFKKVACFTDIHFGLKGNSNTHLKDCEEFVDWYIETAQANGCETGIFLGDWSHNRNSLNLITLDTSLRCLEKLGKGFQQFFWFPGNHDLYYKDKRDIHSSAFGRHIPGVTVVDTVTTLGGVTLVPWLVGDEWKTIEKIKSKYIFGHFELPLFYMNAMVQMPDHGELQSHHFKHPDYVFSGHFHKRQQRDKVIYIGNAFPHNFSDTWDDERGMMILEWGGKPEFHDWEDCPKYRTITLSDLIDRKETVMKSKMHLKVNLDIDISFEEANFIKETFMNEYDIREISLILDKSNLEGTYEDNPDAVFESVDQIVAEQLLSLDNGQYNKNTLIEIYNNL